MRAVVTITGTSLLTKTLEPCILDRRYPDDFLKCLDRNEWDRMSPKDQYDVESVLQVIKEDAVRDLTEFLFQQTLSQDPKKASAETNSLRILINDLMDRNKRGRQDILQDLKLYFVASNTTAGRACAHALCRYFQQEYTPVPTESIVIKQLTGDPATFEKGISELTDELTRLIADEKNQGNNVFLNATGGFKPEAAYTTLCGLINRVDVFYAHEYFGDKLVWLPAIPVGFDFTPWHLNAFKVECALSGQKAAYDSLPAEIKDLMIWNPESGAGSFNQVGHMFWESYRHIYRKHRLSPQREFLADMVKDTHLKDRILGFIDGWDHLWVGMQIPQMIDHGRTHCQNMLMRAEELLLPMKDFLTTEEIYVLIACIWLHDIGHTEPIEIKDDGTEEPLSPQEIRCKHHSLAYQLIKTYPGEFGFPSFNEEARVIAEICRDHRSDLGEVPEECDFKICDDEPTKVVREVRIRRKLITALLQLLDTCDLGGPRAGSDDYVKARWNATQREIKNLEKRREAATLKGEEFFARVLGDQLKMIKPSKYHFDIHQKIAKVELRPKKEDSKWRVRMIIYPAEEGSDVLAITSGKPMYVAEDINRIKAFLRPYNITDVIPEQGPVTSREG